MTNQTSPHIRFLAQPADPKSLHIAAIDRRTQVGANNVYEISHRELPAPVRLTFQSRHINPLATPCGVNGITMEALLLVVQDRLRGFQMGPYYCDENAEALEAIQTALDSLQAGELRRAEERKKLESEPVQA